MKKMQTDRLELTKVHKLILKCFHTLTDGGKELGFTKQSLYKWADDETVLPLYPNPKNADHRKYKKKLKDGFAQCEKKHKERGKNIAKLKKLLLG